MRPVVPAIGRFVNSVAHRHAVPRPRFSRPYPDRLRIRRVHRNRANRLRLLLVEHRFVRRSAVHRLPHAAARRADINRQPPLLLYGGQRRHPPAHRSRSNVPRSQSRNRVGIKLRVLRRYLHRQHERQQNRELRNEPRRDQHPAERNPPSSHCAPPAGFAAALVAGIVYSLSSIGVFASIFSTTIFTRFESPFSPLSHANGKYTPLTWS